MGLYLTVFDNSLELDGIDVGFYADFGDFRDSVTEVLEDGVKGSKYPILILHSDCDGQWHSDEAKQLKVELRDINRYFKQLPPIKFDDTSWQAKTINTFGLEISSLADSFFDVDGEPLLDRLIELSKLSTQRNLPILFQ